MINLVAICAAHGIEEAVLSPGSRSALLTVCFARHPQIRKHVVVDERSAAYAALGIAQQTENTVALVCTSGTAALNYAPAVAEAWYANIPLLIITADRPPEWIDQMDGQAIHQPDIYGDHVKQSFQLPVDTKHPDARWHVERQVSEAINLTRAALPGPVHINVPIREPFYQTLHNPPVDLIKPKLIQEISSEPALSQQQWQDLLNHIKSSKKILILAGQHVYSSSLSSSLESLTDQNGMTVLGDVLSNLQQIPGALTHIDGIVAQLDQHSAEALRSDLLISFGFGLISKHLKVFFRKYPPTQHWHIQEAGQVGDLLQSLTKIVRLKPETFFQKLVSRIDDYQADKAYQGLWRAMERSTLDAQQSFFQDNTDGSDKNNFCDFILSKTILDHLPADSDLHLANSMPVRYANIIGVGNKNLRIYANRGTAGIDGSLSTALGHALATERLQTILIGDLSFFYDSNALWQEILPANLRIVLFNNHGGNIFTMIEGSAKLPECERYFVTPHQRTARFLAEDFRLGYQHADNYQVLTDCLDDFFLPSDKAKILELVTDDKVNTEVFGGYKGLLKPEMKPLL